MTQAGELTALQSLEDLAMLRFMGRGAEPTEGSREQ